MYRAGFRYVFLGIENILEDDLAFLKAAAKNTRRGNDSTRQNTTMAAIDVLHRHRMYRRRRAHRRQPGRYARRDRREPDVREEVRGLALHPAPHALPRHADDQGFPRPRTDRQFEGGRVRRHVRSDAQRSSRC